MSALPYKVERFLEQLAESGGPLVSKQAQYLLDDFDGLTNLQKARAITDEIDSLTRVQTMLKAAFKNDELDGGWRAAFAHPLYSEAQTRKEQLGDELKLLI